MEKVCAGALKILSYVAQHTRLCQFGCCYSFVGPLPKKISLGSLYQYQHCRLGLASMTIVKYIFSLCCRFIMCTIVLTWELRHENWPRELFSNEQKFCYMQICMINGRKREHVSANPSDDCWMNSIIRWCCQHIQRSNSSYFFDVSERHKS